MKRRILTLALVLCLGVSCLAGCGCSSENKEDTEATQQEEIENAVYITDTGKKFHSYGCQYLSDSCHEIDRDEAIDKGYTACSRCNP